RKPIAYARFTINDEGHLIGSSKCLEVWTQLAIIPHTYQYLKMIERDPTKVSHLYVCVKDMGEAVGIFIVEISKAIVQVLNTLSRQLDWQAKMELFLVLCPETALKLVKGGV